MSSWANAESSDEEDAVETPVVTNEATVVTAAAGESVASEGGESQKPRERHERRERHSHGFAVNVANLSYSTSERQLGEFFETGGCKVKSVHIPLSEGKSRGFGIVEFEDQSSADMALTANNEVLNGRSIKVEPRRRKEGGDRRDRHEGGRGRGREVRQSDEIDWTRREKLPEKDSNPSNRDRERDGNRRQRDNFGGRGRRDKDEARESETAAPVTRPKLNILPRSLPIEGRAPSSNTAHIFGEGKPRVASSEVPVAEVKVDSAAAEPEKLPTTAEKPKPKEFERREKSDKGNRGGDKERLSAGKNRDREGRPDRPRDKDREGGRNIPKEKVQKPPAAVDKDDFKEVKENSRKERHLGKKADAANSDGNGAAAASPAPPSSNSTTATNKAKTNRFSYLVSDDEDDE